MQDGPKAAALLIPAFVFHDSMFQLSNDARVLLISMLSALAETGAAIEGDAATVAELFGIPVENLDLDLTEIMMTGANWFAMEYSNGRYRIQASVLAESFFFRLPKPLIDGDFSEVCNSVSELASAKVIETTAEVIQPEKKNGSPYAEEPLREDESLELALWFYEGWWTGFGGQHRLLPICMDCQEPEIERQILSDEEREMVIGKLRKMVPAFVRLVPQGRNSNLRLGLAKARLDGLREEVYKNTWFLGDNEKGRLVSLEWIASGDPQGPARVAQRIMSGEFDRKRRRTRA